MGFKHLEVNLAEWWHQVVHGAPCYVKLEGFVTKEKNGKQTKVKRLNRNPAFIKGDPMVLLAYQKQKLSMTLKALKLHGHTNTNQLADLYEALPQIKPKTPDAQSNKGDSTLPDWAIEREK